MWEGSELGLSAQQKQIPSRMSEEEEGENDVDGFGSCLVIESDPSSACLV